MALDALAGFGGVCAGCLVVYTIVRVRITRQLAEWSHSIENIISSYERRPAPKPKVEEVQNKEIKWLG